MTTSPILPKDPGRVLVASPNPLVRQHLVEKLRSRTPQVGQASGGAEALSCLESGAWQTLLLDRCLPDLDADELSRTVRQRFPGLDVVLLDGNGDAESRSHGSMAGESRILPAGNRRSPLSLAAARPADAGSLLEAPLPGMIGSSPGMLRVYRLTRLVAGRSTTVLVTGPSGSGKELVARAIHSLSPRAARPLVVVNCAAIPETLLESELFGYTRGAFTGALQSYGGRIQAAHGGTLFLDEIGEMPLSLQPKLLRFLEQGELQRLGSTDVVRVETRIVAATNTDLLALVNQGKFRADLYYRLATFPVEIPALRDRQDDIALLAHYFLEKFAWSQPAPKLSREGLERLQGLEWRGNVRELQNVIERSLILSEPDGIIRPEHLLMTALASGRR